MCQRRMQVTSRRQAVSGSGPGMRVPLANLVKAERSRELLIGDPQLVLDRVEDPLLVRWQPHRVLSLAAYSSWLAAVTASPRRSWDHRAGRDCSWRAREPWP
jgi:hypothetical protein